MIEYTPAELYMRKLLTLRGLLDNLDRIHLDGRPAPSIASYYGILHLHQFIGAYHGLMGALGPDQKKLVACLSDLVTDIDSRRSGLRAVRDNWIAHLQDDDKFINDASEFLRNAKLPENPTWYRGMSECAIVFVDAVQALLPDIAVPVMEKFNNTPDARPAGRVFNPWQATQNVRARLKRAQRRASEEYPDCPWAALLGILGVGPEKLGGDIS